MRRPLFSVLILGVSSRLSSSGPRIFRELERQAQGKSAEICYLIDNKCRTVGAKRNAIMKIANGDYVAFVDDDDRVALNYVSHILNALASRPDVVVFDVAVSGYASLGHADKIAHYDLSFAHENLPTEFRRRPNHVMVWRTALARSVPFADVSRGEDDPWAAAMIARHPRLKQVRISETLYYYDFNVERSETYPGKVGKRAIHLSTRAR